MTMYWGYAHAGLPFNPKLVARLARDRFRHCELRVTDVNYGGTLFDQDLAKRWRSAAEENNFTLSLHYFAGVNLGEKVDRLRETSVAITRDQLRFGAACGARWLTLHLGHCGFNGDPYRKRRRLGFARDAVRQLCRQTADLDIKIGLENVQRLPDEVPKSYLGDCLDDFEFLLDGLPHDQVGIVFDIGHAKLYPERERLAFLNALRAHLLAVHIHDNDGVTDHHWALPEQWRRENAPLAETLLELGRSGVALILENHEPGFINQSRAVLAER